MHRKVFFVFCLCIISIARAQNPALDWATHMGGSNGDCGYSIALDPAGNAISTGTYIGAIDMDPGPAVVTIGNINNAQGDVYVQKLSTTGQLVWARSFGGNNADVAYGIETDAGGAIYLAGSFSGTCDFDPGPATYNISAVAGSDIFILKLNAAGIFCWVQTYSSTGASGDGAISIARCSQNRMVISGSIYGSCDFDPGPGVSMVSYPDSLGENIFMVCLDTAGQFSWSAGIGGTGWDESNEVKCDPSGNTYLTGIFTGTVDFDPGSGSFPLTSMAGTQNIFALKLDPAGNLIYADAFPGTIISHGVGMTCTPTGEAIFSGAFWGTVDFDPGPGTNNITAVGMNDIFICKLNSTGDLLWIKTIGSSSNEISRAMTSDQSGNIYLTGDFTSTLDFDPGTGVHNLSPVTAANDIFIEKLDSAGNFAWVTMLGSASSDYCFSIKTDANNSVYTTGRFSGAADFDPTNGSFVLTANQTDAFVQKYSQCTTDTVQISVSSCSAYTLNNQTYTTSGNYTQNTTGTDGCDSVILLDLTINSVDVSVTVNDPIITANAGNATYQWINCENGFPLPGDTLQSFTPALNGSYAVIVTQGNCTDTSVCSTIIGLDVTSGYNAPLIFISENPNHGRFLVQTDVTAQLLITDVTGKQIYVQNIQPHTATEIQLPAAGMYMVTAITADGKSTAQKVLVLE